MSKKLVIANWKMNLNYSQARELSKMISKNNFKNDLVVAPSNLYLKAVLKICENNPQIMVSSQNVSEYDNGAYTGEVSAKMLKSLGVSYCIIGHSERRLYFGEESKLITTKINQCLKNNIVAIFCVGEQENDRDKNEHFKVVKNQILSVLDKINVKSIKRLIVAYEPVWAIGTGKTATPSQAQEMHLYIRNLIKEKYGLEISETIKIVYGGSCNKNNAKDLFKQKDIDGGLVGGASLIHDDFIEIVRIGELF